MDLDIFDNFSSSLPVSKKHDDEGFESSAALLESSRKKRKIEEEEEEEPSSKSVSLYNADAYEIGRIVCWFYFFCH